MKFKSRKDILFKVFTLGSLSLLLAILVYISMGNLSWLDILVLLLVSAVIGLILWIYFDTSYKIMEKKVYYKSGPFRGNIEINKINGIIKGKTKWSGFKAATSQNGLIIKYNKYREIYISPKTNDTFVTALLKLNNDITITG